MEAIHDDCRRRCIRGPNRPLDKPAGTLMDMKNCVMELEQQATPQWTWCDDLREDSFEEDCLVVTPVERD